jgi:hypothetical protein
VKLVLLKRDPEGDGWTREGSGTALDDDARGSGDDKARARGEKWVSEDPENRDFSIVPLGARRRRA